MAVADNTFVRYAVSAGMATPAQVAAARDLQAAHARAGRAISLADALVAARVITPAQRETVVQRLREAPSAGTPMIGRYKVLRKLGEGGMGTVYLALDGRSGRQIAVKVLARAQAADAARLKRFQREAVATARLKHPNIVRAFAYGEDKGFAYFVMEYCEGETLDKRLRRAGPLPSRDAALVVLQAARGLQYAHARGIIHRDIKPSNLILAKTGEAKILDLGLSKRLDASDASFRTQDGVALGTPHYIAPEQARGEREVDGRADLYSLGATFYHLVTGEPPFHGASPLEVMGMHVHGQVPDPQDVKNGIPDAIAHVIRRMMAKDPADRYRDCGALVEDLVRVLKGGAPASRPLDARKSTVALKAASGRVARPGPAKAIPAAAHPPRTAPVAAPRAAPGAAPRTAPAPAAAHRRRSRAPLLLLLALLALAGGAAWYLFIHRGGDVSGTVSDLRQLKDRIAAKVEGSIPAAETPGTGAILWECWAKIPGPGVADLVAAPAFQKAPDEKKDLDAFRAPAGAAAGSGARIRGFLLPPKAGDYVFKAEGGAIELRLSPSEDPAAAKPVAAAPVRLEAGRRYYVEALLRIPEAGARPAVGWQLPDGTTERPIPGSRLSKP
jgi:serine/threonine-protein kinase